KVLFIRKGGVAMERGSNYRMLKLMEILFRETDDQHELGIDDLIAKLRKETGGIRFDKRTIKRDLATLDDMDFEIVENIGDYGKILYSHQSRLFETYQLRLLVDAVLSARFITPKEKEILIDKIKQLTSDHIAKTLPEPVLFSQSSNMDYELVKLNIDHVHRAISERKVLTYQYGRFNVDKQFEYSRNGATYHVEPYALIWQNDLYYLIGRYEEPDEMRHYWLDRIRNIAIGDKTLVKKNFALQAYVDKSFHMFSGKDIRIKIRFHNELINVVWDRFWLEAEINKDGEDDFILKTKAKLWTGLFIWILKYGDIFKVLSSYTFLRYVYD